MEKVYLFQVPEFVIIKYLYWAKSFRSDEKSVMVFNSQTNDSKCHTWKTFGAPTILASADDKVAEKIPAKIRGSKAEAMPIAYKNASHCYKHKHIRLNLKEESETFRQTTT